MNYAIPKQIGNHNKNQMLSILREKGKTSRVELSRLLNISPTAVTRNISKLMETGVIRECGADKSVIGRKPVLMELCSEYCYVLGADVVGGTIKVALANLTGEIVKLSEEPLNPAGDGEHAFLQLLDGIKRMIDTADVPAEKIRAVCVGTPGIFNAETGKSRFTFFLDGWDDIDLQGRISEELGIETVIENDVNLDVIGENWKGSGKQYDSVIYVKLGQGLSSRIVLQGKLLRGENNMAGEIAYMLPGVQNENRLNYENMLCNDALSVRYKHAARDSSANSYTLSDLITMRRQGDRTAKAVLDYLLEQFSITLLNSVVVLDPQVIILGGDASHFDDDDVGFLKSRFDDYFPLNQKIIRSGLDKQACIYGAIKLGLDLIEERIITTL